jgi:hypothetical protein
MDGQDSTCEDKISEACEKQKKEKGTAYLKKKAKPMLRFSANGTTFFSLA